MVCVWSVMVDVLDPGPTPHGPLAIQGLEGARPPRRKLTATGDVGVREGEEGWGAPFSSGGRLLQRPQLQVGGVLSEHLQTGERAVAVGVLRVPKGWTDTRR